MGIRVITVSRQFGSGGRTIAKETAERLGWAYYDKELVKRSPRRAACESYILEAGEYACSTSSFLFNWVMNAESARSGSLPISDQLYNPAQHYKDLAEKERCVIVGRCADYILRAPGLPSHLLPPRTRPSVRTGSSGSTESGQEKGPKSAQRKRTTSAAPLPALHRPPVGPRREHDICLDSGRLGIDQCVDILVNAAKA